MRIFEELNQVSFDDQMRLVIRHALAIAIGLLSVSVISGMARAQTTLPSVGESIPTVINVVNGPACASSANGTGHLICVSESNNQLYASSVLAAPGAFAVPIMDPAANANPAAGPLNPLPLGISGTVGNSSCSSTADATGDVVCAYNANGSLMGVRFHILGAPQNVTVQPLGISVSSNNASCALGSQRFTVQGPVPLHQGAITVPVANEGPAGETICAVQNATGELIGIAFNPLESPQVPHSMDLGVEGAVPSCTDAFDGTGTNQVVCAFFGVGGLLGVAFDPRPATISESAVQQLSISGTPFNTAPGCATPNDNSGDVICAIGFNSGVNQKTSILGGIAFNPRTAVHSALMQLGLNLMPAPSNGQFVNPPSCAAQMDGSNAVICASRANLGIVNGSKFDPRGVARNLGQVVSSTTSASNVSCTFQNMNGNQVSCGGATGTQEELIGVVLGANAGTNIPPPNSTLINDQGNLAKNPIVVGQLFTVSWSAAAGATSYKFWKDGTLFQTLSPGTLSLQISESTVGSHTAQVQACDASGCSTGSNVLVINVQ
jgi:hypothetical protein